MTVLAIAELPDQIRGYEPLESDTGLAKGGPPVSGAVRVRLLPYNVWPCHLVFDSAYFAAD